ncbi:allantoin permease [Fundicoccus sp. Sow4_D5]|uniref:allantoin permease n=1 Tax=unclassified Fundicoccus TaxID=2761543 RepID=UPI003F9257F5
MEAQDYKVTQAEITKFQARGYTNEDILPKPAEKRHTGLMNYFTLWMGSVHNIPNYAAVGGFLVLGMAPINVMLALVVSALVVALFMTMNGLAGSKYGIPFSMHLRSTYGNTGSKLPGFLRGGVAAIAWFGLQNYTGSQALLILISKLWPGFLQIGDGTSILGISIPGLIAFTIFWAANMLIGLGGGGILNKFTAILSPIIYIVFGGMTIWAINVAGGIENIMSYDVAGATAGLNPIVGYLMIIASVLAVWAAPGVSVADFTQNAKSSRDQVVGQTASFLVSYVGFAFASVVILIGGSINAGTTEWDVLNIINSWDSTPAIIISSLVLLMTTISTNATGNIIPAAYQLTALLPKYINYRSGVIIASVVSFLIMPWKLMENADSIYIFLNAIGALLGPVAGIMVAHYFLLNKQRIDLDQLYFDERDKAAKSIYRGTNTQAYIATFVGLVVSLSGQFIPALAFISNVAWLAGFGTGFLVYWLLTKTASKDSIIGAIK